MEILLKLGITAAKVWLIGEIIGFIFAAILFVIALVIIIRAFMETKK